VVEVETPKEPEPKKPKPPKESKPQVARHDEHAEAYKAAFDSHFPETYAWTKVDFIQLVAMRKAYPDVTPAQFADTAKKLWDEGTYTPGYALTIAGLASRWAQARAKVENANRNSNNRGTGSIPPAQAQPRPDGVRLEV
jgi:hypothetical protein